MSWADLAMGSIGSIRARCPVVRHLHRSSNWRSATILLASLLLALPAIAQTDVAQYDALLSRYAQIARARGYAEADRFAEQAALDFQARYGVKSRQYGHFASILSQGNL